MDLYEGEDVGTDGLMHALTMGDLSKYDLVAKMKASTAYNYLYIGKVNCYNELLVDRAQLEKTN